MTDLAALADELERLEKQATEGPWCWDNRGEKGDDIQLGTAVLKNDKQLIGHFDDESAIYVDHVAEIHGGSGDAALICTLRNAAPQLIEALRELGREQADHRNTVEVLAMSNRIADSARERLRQAEGIICAMPTQLLTAELAKRVVAFLSPPEPKEAGER